MAAAATAKKKNVEFDMKTGKVKTLPTGQQKMAANKNVSLKVLKNFNSSLSLFCQNSPIWAT